MIAPGPIGLLAAPDVLAIVHGPLLTLARGRHRLGQLASWKASDRAVTERQLRKGLITVEDQIVQRPNHFADQLSDRRHTIGQYLRAGAIARGGKTRAGIHGPAHHSAPAHRSRQLYAGQLRNEPSDQPSHRKTDHPAGPAQYPAAGCAIGSATIA